METKPLSAMPKLKTNLDTDFLKLIAILSMVIDHVGTAFFPEYHAFRWAGRLAFPIFAYCLTVGLLYTRDIRKYLLRLGAFALISQPFYIFAFHPAGKPASPVGSPYQTVVAVPRPIPAG